MPYTRKPIVGGNFKANGTLEFITKHIETLSKADYPENIDIVVCPSLLHAVYVQQHRGCLQVGVQNNWIKPFGAWTGETPVEMIKDAGIEWVIVGHSERRHVIGESDELSAEKALVCLKQGLKIMFCIGETLDEREAGQTLDVNKRQLEALRVAIGNEKQYWDNVVIAYEPVWSIGTGKTASPEQAQEVHHAIRAWIAEKVDKEGADCG